MTCLLSPNHGGPRNATTGVVIHSTRGGADPSQEFQATIDWFANPASQVSAHAVVSIAGELCYPVDSTLIAWHAREYNDFALGIEFCEPTIDDPFTDAQITAGALVVRAWCQQYGIPIDRDHIQGHSEIPPGIRDGKTDPGPLFPWDTFMAQVGGQIAPPVEPPPIPVNSDATGLIVGLLLLALGAKIASLAFLEHADHLP